MLHIDYRVGNTLPQTLPSSGLFLFENVLLNQSLQTKLFAYLTINDPSISFFVNCSICTLVSHEDEA